MKIIHFTLEPLSPTATPYRGDMLMGVLLWMFVYKYGADELEKLLEAISENPPAISDLFPGDKLPRPIFPFSHQCWERLEFSNAAEYRKEVKDIHSISVQEWLEIREAMSEFNVLNILLRKVKARRKRRVENLNNGSMSSEEAEDITQLHATINRMTGTTGERHGLFSQIRTHFNPQSKLHGWLYPGAIGEDRMKEILNLAGVNGYGGDASTGNGQFKVDFSAPELHTSLFAMDGADGWMSTSKHFPPSHVDANGSYWTVETHYGRLGGNYAVGSNPFKKPLLLMGCGSVWNQAPPPKPAGAILDNVAFPPLSNKVKHLGFTIPLPFRWGK